MSKDIYTQDKGCPNPRLHKTFKNIMTTPFFIALGSVTLAPVTMLVTKTNLSMKYEEYN